MGKKIAIVVPCFNEEESLPLFFSEIKKWLNEINGYNYEIVMVNDGSTDNSLDIIINEAKIDSHIKYISFSRNFGKEAAMYAGLKNADGDYVAVMDADLQDPPKLLPKMIQILEGSEYDSVATRRVTRKGEPIVRSFFARLFYKIINKVSDAKIIDGARDYRLLKRKMVNAIVSMGEYNRFTKGIFGWIGFRTFWLEYENVERCAGKTKWNFWKLFKYGVDGIINFSSAPLRIASFAGILMTFFSFIWLIIIIVRRLLYGNQVIGWASQVCIMLFIGGIQLFCLGIIGQYIAKIYMETKNRPIYIVDETNIEIK